MANLRKYLADPAKNAHQQSGDAAIKICESIRRANHAVTSALEQFNKAISPDRKPDLQNDDELTALLAEAKGEKARSQIAEVVREEVVGDFVEAIKSWQKAAGKTEAVCRGIISQAADATEGEPTPEDKNRFMALLNSCVATAKAGAEQVVSLVPSKTPTSEPK